MNKIIKESVLQIIMMLLCLFILAFQFPFTSSHAQSQWCNGEPKHWRLTNPLRWTWERGTEVSVVIFDTPSETDFQIISNAVREWNAYSLANCSGVTFKPATRANRPYDPDEIIPDNTIFIPRVNPTQVFQRLRNPDTPLQSLRAALIQLDPRRVYNPIELPNAGGGFRKTVAHEVGHAFNLANEGYNHDTGTTSPAVPGRSIMGIAGFITDCDTEAIKRIYCPEIPDGCYVPLNDNLSTEENSRDSSQRPIDPHECGPYYEWNPTTCECDIYTPPSSPVLIDTLGNGFNLTNNLNGVRFDLNNDGRREQLSWTSAGSDDAWLALDRNSNGTVDGGKELFGNFTPQPAPPLGEERNGFLALAEYDKPSQGGNNDGEISQQDLIFTRLRLWRDTNHNGISETNELHQLNDSGLRKIELDYRESRKTDEFGNQFKYRAKVRDAQDAQMNRWAWDVFLVTEP